MNSKQLHKAERKIKRFQQTILKEVQVEPSLEPTNSIVICNAGQATGLSSEEVFLIADKYISRNDITQCILPKGKSYCFVQFRSNHSSVLFYSNINGIFQKRPDNFDGPLYLSYIKNVPIISNDISMYLPPGLTLINDFLTENEETALIQLFDWGNNEVERGTLKQREVRHFRYEFRYGSNDVDKTSPLEEKIPDECGFIWQRLANHGITVAEPPDQLTINKYKPGQGIPPHVDSHSPFGPTLVSISLGSPVVMDWKHWSGKKTLIDVPNRSILVMENESRYDWLHGIAARMWDPVKIDSNQENHTNDSFGRRSRGVRISLTFRWLTNTICQCDYPRLCDRKTYLLRMKLQNSAVNDENIIASALEDIHVHQIYEDIAPHFNVTRHKPWPCVVNFINRLSAGSILLDLGAGNGKNISKRNDLVQIAVERSSGLLKVCMEQSRKTNSSDCLRGDALSVPMRDSAADAVICIAVLHHFANEDRRKKAISEIIRLLRVGGCALITVWARDQSGSSYLKGETNYPKVPCDEPIQSHNILPGLSLPIHENRTQFQQGDLLVPWKLRNVHGSGELDSDNSVLLRYYHVFEKGEMEKLCSSMQNVAISESFYDQGNWCVILTKLESI